MADPPHYSDNGDDTGVGLDPGSPPRAPRWVYVSGVIAIILVLLFVIVHLSGGGLGSHAH